MAKVCFKEYEKYLIDNGVRTDKLSKQERLDLQAEHESHRKVAEEQNIDLETEVDGKTFGDNLIDEEARLQNKQDLDDYLSSATDLQKAIHFKRDFRATVNGLVEAGDSLDVATRKALVGLIIDNYDTKYAGRSPLLELVKSEQVTLRQELHAVTKEHFDMNWDAFMKPKNKKTVEAFFRELIEIEKTKNITGKSVTGNIKAQAVARGYYQMKITKMANRILTGDKASLDKVNQKIVWDPKEVRKFTEEEFITKHIDDLDTKVHGEDVAVRREVLRKVYQDIKKGNWRIVGDTTQAGTKKSLRQKSPILTWKDGATFLRMHTDYSRISIHQQIITDMNNFGRENANREFFGNNPEINKRFYHRTANKIGKSMELNYTLDRMDAALRPETYETNNTYARIQNLKNLQVASKLGQATIVASLDVPTAILGGKGLFGMPIRQLIKLGGVNLTLKQEIQWAREAGFIFDDIVGRMSDDFSSGATYGGKISNVIDKTAQISMKVSFLQQWTNIMSGGVQGILSRHLGKFIKLRTAFKDLPKPLQRTLAKYGIDDVPRGGQPAWQRLLDGDVLDERGFIYMRKIDENVFETAYGNISLRNNLNTMFRDVADTLIIKGGDYDKALTNFFQDDRTVFGSLISALNQFKQIPVGIWRKIILRHWKDNGAANSLAFAAMFFATTTAMGFLINDAKDFVKGRQPVSDPADRWGRALITGGGFGIFSDVMMQFGGEELMKVLYGKSKGDLRPKEMIFGLFGPVFSDLMKLTEGIGEFGLSLINEEDNDVRTKLRPLTRTVLGMVPFQNLWWANLVFRKYIHEFLQEIADPIGWNKTQKKLERRAVDTRKDGKYDNFIYESLPDLK